MPGLNVIDVSKRGPMVGDMYVTVFRTNKKWQDYVYIQCEYKSTKQKIKHLLREENKVMWTVAPWLLSIHLVLRCPSIR